LIEEKSWSPSVLIVSDEKKKSGGEKLEPTSGGDRRPPPGPKKKTRKRIQAKGKPHRTFFFYCRAPRSGVGKLRLARVRKKKLAQQYFIGTGRGKIEEKSCGKTSKTQHIFGRGGRDQPQPGYVGFNGYGRGAVRKGKVNGAKVFGGVAEGKKGKKGTHPGRTMGLGNMSLLIRARNGGEKKRRSRLPKNDQQKSILQWKKYQK